MNHSYPKQKPVDTPVDTTGLGISRSYYYNEKGVFKIKSLMLGTVYLISLLIVSSLLKQPAAGIKIIGLTGLLAMGLAAVFSGSLGKGDRIRANCSSEQRDDFSRRQQLVACCFWFALPNLLLALAYYLIQS